MTWLPAEYQDETIPPPRESPDAWIIALDDGAPALAGWDDLTNDGASPLHDGRIVQFNEFTDHGWATVTVEEDGKWSADRTMPPAANCVALEFEYAGNSLEDAIKEGFGFGEPMPPGEYEVHYYQWSDDIPFRFDAATRSFIREPINDQD